MAKKNTGSGALALILLAWLVSSVASFAVANWVGIALVSSVIACIWFIAKANRNKKEKLAYETHTRALLEKYKDEDIVNRILNREYWIGQTKEQLTDSLGVPDNTEKTVLKTKTKEVWKYGETRKGQYQLRLNIEKGLVVGFSDKSAG